MCGARIIQKGVKRDDFIGFRYEKDWKEIN